MTDDRVLFKAAQDGSSILQYSRVERSQVDEKFLRPRDLNPRKSGTPTHGENILRDLEKCAEAMNQIILTLKYI